MTYGTLLFILIVLALVGVIRCQGRLLKRVSKMADDHEKQLYGSEDWRTSRIGELEDSLKQHRKHMGAFARFLNVEYREFQEGEVRKIEAFFPVKKPKTK